MFGLTRKRDEYLADWIDLVDTQDGEIIRTGTGGLLRCAEYEPPDLETAGREERQAIADRFTELLTVPGTGWSLWVDKWHLEDRGYLPRSDFGGNHAALLVDDARRAQFAEAKEAVFTDRHVLSMHWSPQNRDAMRAILLDQDTQSERERYRTFQDRTDELLRGLSLLCPAVEVITDHALATYLALPITYRRIETSLPKMPEIIAMQFGGLAEWDTGFEMTVDGLHVVAIEVHSFGAITPETVEELHELPFPYRWTTVLHCMDPDHQRRAIQWDRKRWEPKQFSLPGWVAVSVARDRSFGRAKPDVAIAMAELDELESGLHAEKDGLAIASMTIRVWDENKAVANERAQSVVSLLNAGDMRSRIATFPALGGVADIPGNASRDLVNRRRPKVHLSKMAKCSPLTGLTTGYREDRHLNGPALMVGHSRRRGPLFLSLHAPGNDVGHMAVIGPTGAGKSSWASFAACQYFRYPGSTVTMFDMRRSAMVTTLCLEGTWLELGTGGMGVQPLRDLDTAEGMAWASSWCLEALKMRQVMPTSRVDAALNEALIAVRALPADQRTISALCAHLGGHEETRSALSHYTGSGPLGMLMDGAVPGYGNARMLCIEIEPVMHLAEAPLILSACFRQIEHERIVGEHPKLLMIDEAWKPLGHPLFRNRIEDMARTFRKLNAQLVLFTQSVRDLEGEQTAVIMEQMAQTIYLPNAKATDEASARLYRDRGLSDDQIMMVGTMMPKGEYMIHGSWTRIASFRLDGAALEICGRSRPADIARARRLMGEQSKVPFVERWLAEDEILAPAKPRARRGSKRIAA